MSISDGFLSIGVPKAFEDFGKRMRSVVDKITEIASGGVNDAAENFVEQTTENVENMIALDRIELFNMLNIDPATKSRTTCTIKIDARFAVELSAMSARQTNEGVEVQVYRFGPPLLYADAFGPNIPKLRNGIYIRVGRSSYPIRQIKQLKLASDPKIKETIDINKKKIEEDATLAVRNRLGNIVYGMQA